MFSKDIPRKPFFLMKIKGHNSENNRWIFSLIELGLYFIIINLCIKFESNIPMYSKDITRKPFFVWRLRAITLIIIGGFYPESNLTCNFMIIYLCMKFESNTPMVSKDIARKPLFVRTNVWTNVMLYSPPPPPPPLKIAGHK